MKVTRLIGSLACLSVMCAFARAQETESFSVEDELKKALDGLSKAASYTFESVSKRESEGGGRGGRGGGPTEVKGKYGAEVGVVGEMSGAKVARVGDQVVYTDD